MAVLYGNYRFSCGYNYAVLTTCSLHCHPSLHTHHGQPPDPPLQISVEYLRSIEQGIERADSIVFNISVYSAVQCSTVQYSTVAEVDPGVVYNISIVLNISVVQYIQCNVVQCSAVYYSTVQYSTV